MGLTFTFYLGNSDEIVSAVEAVDLDRLDDPEVVQQRADFSLHILPKDLDLLSIAIGRTTSVEPMPLRPHLTVLLDEPDRGVLAVNQRWVKYVAAAREHQVADLARQWGVEMRRAYGNEVVVSDAVVRAVRDLLIVCQAAQATGDKLLHVWFA